MRTLRLSRSHSHHVAASAAAVPEGAGATAAARGQRRLRALARAGRLRSGRLAPPEPRSAPRLLLPLCAAAAALPQVSAPLLAERAGPALGVLWLLALVPAFLLAYHLGWRGGASAAAAGGGLALALAAARLAGPEGLRPADALSAVGAALAYAAVALGAGALAEALRRDRERAIRLALTDDLTGLPNRRSGRWFLDKEFAAAERGRPVSVVLFDLDQFKRYNDRHGHPAGDAALRVVAAVLDRATRRMNLAARHGGEEFLCVLSSAAAEDALVFVGKVRDALRAADVPCEPVTLSAGVASYDPTMATPDDLLAAADCALYQAKRSGGDCVRLAGEPSAARAVR